MRYKGKNIISLLLMFFLLANRYSLKERVIPAHVPECSLTVSAGRNTTWTNRGVLLIRPIPTECFINGTGERDGLPRAVFPVGIAVLIWAICERLPKIPVLSAGGYLPSKK